MKILLQAVKQLAQRFLEDTDEECAGEYSYGICNKIKVVRLAVGGEDPLRGFGESGKEESCDEQHGENEPLAHFYCFVVCEHQPSGSGVCKEHKEMGKLVHWDAKKVFWQLRSLV